MYKLIPLILSLSICITSFGFVKATNCYDNELIENQLRETRPIIKGMISTLDHYLKRDDIEWVVKKEIDRARKVLDCTIMKS